MIVYCFVPPSPLTFLDTHAHARAKPLKGGCYGQENDRWALNPLCQSGCAQGGRTRAKENPPLIPIQLFNLFAVCSSHLLFVCLVDFGGALVVILVTVRLAAL